MNLEEQFEQAQLDSRMLPERPDKQTMLQIYGLFRQAWHGDVEGPRPGFTDLAGREKWAAWAELKGLSREDAMQQYIDLIARLAD